MKKQLSKYFNHAFFYAPLLIMPLIFGCSVPLAVSLEKDPEGCPELTDSSKGIIYVYREGEFTGCLRGIFVNINGERVGAINSGTYFSYITEPGEYVVSLGNGLGEDPARTITIEVGGDYYLRGDLKMGLWDADPKLCIVDPQEGREAIKQLQCATLKKK
jgi:hypothetical protein